VKYIECFAGKYTIETLLFLFSFNMNKYGTYDYEFLGFTHNDIDNLFQWNREIQ